MSAYQDRVNAERLARQAQPVKLAAEDIRTTLKSIEQCLYWAIDPEEKDGGAQWASSLIEHAHALLDLGHEYRARLVENPPPKEEKE